jgi:hypothetical protein
LLLRLVASVLSFWLLATQLAAQTPHLLLTAQRLKRLKREYQRQDERWANFDERLKNVTDSPDRGFELALYFAVTGDEARGKEAIAWANEHPCERRQVALIRDWVGTENPAPHGCTNAGQISPESVRDDFFAEVASGADPTRQPLEMRRIQETVLSSAKQMYAMCEYLIAWRELNHSDLREEASTFFLKLPIEFLLSRNPNVVEQPDWMTHAAGLALVALDPNLQSAQFLQGWVMEQKQTLRQGPGVAYELLWADPYLPGVGYQNLDPWVYDDAGRLFARTGWNPDACWVAITAHGADAVHCPPDWKQKTASFGHLRLMPFSGGCVQIPAFQNTESVVLWRLAPGQSVTFRADHGNTMTADAAGMLRVGANLSGKACAVKPEKP